VGLVFMLALGACDDDGGLDPPTGSSAISGTVARQKTAEGVPGAVLALVDGEGTVLSTTFTDGSGRFAFQSVDQGDYEVRLVAPELAGLDPLYDALEPAVWEVALGSDPVELVFAVVGLIPARITGTVTCAGAPVAGVGVRVVGGATDVTVTTEASGIFTARDLLPGTYAVIPLMAPCSLDPPFSAAIVRPGQFVDLSFGG
jgi:hypothetical protein